MSVLAALLDEQYLRRLAGDRSFERGADYAASGRVVRLTRSQSTVEADVQGTHRYRVELGLGDNELKGRCSCPMAASGAFCKHCVAVGLVALEAPAGRSAGISLEDVRAHLGALKKDELVELLLEEAREDEGLLDRLRLQAASGEEAIDIASFRDAIDRAVDPGVYIGYAEAHDYSRTLEQTVNSLRAVLAAGHAAEAVDLVEYCCASIERSAGSVDDSDGHLSTVFASLQRLHREACEQARFDPVKLAERLFTLMMDTDYELFYDAAEVYAPLLGEAGQECYAKLVRSEWERLPELGPQDDRRARRSFTFLIGNDELSERRDRFRITYVMKLLAGQSGDPDEMVDVLSKDLSSPYSFLRIAEVYAEAGRDEDAIEWAERGTTAFDESPDSRLVTFLAEAVRSRGEHERAAELVWSLFEAHPGLENFIELKPYAEEAGRWGEMRDRALNLLRDRIASVREERRDRGYGWSWSDATELVRVRLWEGDTGAALREAREGGCRPEVWLALAEALEVAEPRVAADIYREQVEPMIEHKNKAAYRKATDMIIKIRDLMARTGQAGDFPEYLEEVRTAHKRKRNLMKLLRKL